MFTITDLLKRNKKALDNSIVEAIITTRSKSFLDSKQTSLWWSGVMATKIADYVNSGICSTLKQLYVNAFGFVQEDRCLFVQHKNILWSYYKIRKISYVGAFNIVESYNGLFDQ